MTEEDDTRLMDVLSKLIKTSGEMEGTIEMYVKNDRASTGYFEPIYNKVNGIRNQLLQDVYILSERKKSRMRS